MKIKIRYENEYQTLEVENMELEKWLNISISEDESQEDYEKRIQDVIEERFNRPDYNSWHKHDRHTGNAYMKSKDGTVEVNTEEAIMFRATDKSAFNSSINGVHNQLEYEDCCETLRSLLKPAVADMVIAIALDGYTVGEYATEIGDDDNNVSHRYRRAINKLKKVFQKNVLLTLLPRLPIRRQGSPRNYMEVIRMDELIRINFDSDRPTVSGRDLHAALEVRTAYKDWFPRMCDYGFEEGTDFRSFLSESTGGRPATDHQLTIAMAKELCMIQRSEAGRKFRQYFIKVEEAWNSPEAVMARALQFANNQLSLVKKQNLELLETVAVQNQQIAEMKPKASYYDVVLNCKDLVAISVIAKDYGWTANHMNQYLHEKGIQFKQGKKIWLLYKEYAEMGLTSTKTHTYSGSDGSTHSKSNTYWTQKGRLFIYDLLKKDGILPIMEQED